jgi:hypothetical protein
MHGPRSVLDVLRVANFLSVAVVNDAARGYLACHLAPRNALRVAALAEAHGLAEARDVAVAYAGDHFGELAAAPVRCRLSRVDVGTLRVLLASDELRVEGELNVFTALMAWLDARDGEVAAGGGGGGGGDADADGAARAATRARGGAAAAAANAAAPTAVRPVCAGAGGGEESNAPAAPAACPSDLLGTHTHTHTHTHTLTHTHTRSLDCTTRSRPG